METFLAVSEGYKLYQLYSHIECDSSGYADAGSLGSQPLSDSYKTLKPVLNNAEQKPPDHLVKLHI